MKKILALFVVSGFLSACGSLPAGFPGDSYSTVELQSPCDQNAKDGEANSCVKPCVYKKDEDLKWGEKACLKPKQQP